MRAVVLHRAGERILSRRTVNAQWLRVGRNANCEVHLPDSRISLEQGMIVDREGPVYIEGEAGSTNITRKAVRSVRLKRGEPVDIGPYRITAQTPPPAFDLALSVELVRPLLDTDDLTKRTSRRTLASVGLSKRGVAWGLMALVLLVFLLLPAGRVLDMPWSEAAQTLPVGDRFWNPGPLTLAHQPIEQKCGSCHEKAFETVRNVACLDCHAKVGTHVAPGSKHAGMFAEAKCASCHSEHKGVRATHRDSDRLCVDCHRDGMGSQARGNPAPNISDFVKDHPSFRLTMLGADGKLQRVRQGSGALVEATGLKFPHDLHVNKAGVKSPSRGRVRLDCGDCHVPDATRRSFTPVSMAKHCQECHRLEFEPAVTTREAPHGDPAVVATVIEEFYANLALKGTPDSFQRAFGVGGQGLLRRAGEPSAAERRSALSLAGQKAARVAQETMEVRVCVACHEVRRSGAQAWEVAPVAASHAWMPHARFDHKTHAHARCVDCHAKSGSRDANEVSMPDIAKCRDCHAGSKAAAGKLMSSCLLCHGFHDATHPWHEKGKHATR